MDNNPDHVDGFRLQLKDGVPLVFSSAARLGPQPCALRLAPPSSTIAGEVRNDLEVAGDILEFIGVQVSNCRAPNVYRRDAHALARLRATGFPAHVHVSRLTEAEQAILNFSCNRPIMPQSCSRLTDRLATGLLSVTVAGK